MHKASRNVTDVWSRIPEVAFCFGAADRPDFRGSVGRIIAMEGSWPLPDPGHPFQPTERVENVQLSIYVMAIEELV